MNIPNEEFEKVEHFGQKILCTAQTSLVVEHDAQSVHDSRRAIYCTVANRVMVDFLYCSAEHVESASSGIFLQVVKEQMQSAMDHIRWVRVQVHWEEEALQHERSSSHSMSGPG
ncbi:hypothetical protein HG530_000766 [Fusarium avenaceum]|nr:hypothetical protein HG530_000766 [Fusarium avenaceum]